MINTSEITSFYLDINSFNLEIHKAICCCENILFNIFIFVYYNEQVIKELDHESWHYQMIQWSRLI